MQFADEGFFLLSSYLPPYAMDTAIAILADHHHLLLKTTLAILNAGLSTWRISNWYVQQHVEFKEWFNFVHKGVVHDNCTLELHSFWRWAAASVLGICFLTYKLNVLLTTPSNSLGVLSLEHSLLLYKEICTEKKSIVIRINMEIHGVIFGTRFVQPVLGNPHSTSM